MRRILTKINHAGAYPIVAAISIFVVVVASSIYLRIAFGVVAISCLFTFISSLLGNKNETLRLLSSFFGSLAIASLGVFLIDDYWNKNAVLIAKTGFIILVGFFFVSALIFSTISAIALFTHLKELLKYNELASGDSEQSGDLSKD